MSTQLTPVVPQERDNLMFETAGFPARYARFGNFQVDLQRQELYQDGQRVKLQAQVYRALLLLLSRAGDIISREDVRKWLWPEVFLVNLNANVNTTMNKLRQALGDSPETPRYIETMPRRGYSFIAAVEFSEVPDTRPVGVSVGTSREAAIPNGLPAPTAPRFRAALRLASFLLAGMLLGALLMFVWFFAQAKRHRAFETGKAVASRSTLDAGSVRM
jgi:DNA-binding winged helix-turn-helix (wHTH) protein